jgi:thiamine biosynthesis protein ThiS
MSMILFFNGERIEQPEGSTLSSLLSSYGLKKEAVVIELNGLVIQKDQYDNTALKDQDQIECIHFMAGG